MNVLILFLALYSYPLVASDFRVVLRIERKQDLVEVFRLESKGAGEPVVTIDGRSARLPKGSEKQIELLLSAAALLTYDSLKTRILDGDDSKSPNSLDHRVLIAFWNQETGGILTTDKAETHVEELIDSLQKIFINFPKIEENSNHQIHPNPGVRSAAATRERGGRPVTGGSTSMGGDRKMKLYLSSFRLGESPEHLAELADGKGPFAFISNALDYFTDLEKKNAVIARGIEDLQGIGLESHPIDLREYFGSPEELRAGIGSYRAVFVTGGNAFILKRALELSGMDSYLREKMGDEDFLYAGYSAGACVAGPTMKGLHLVDDPEELPDGYSPEVSWDGLSLIDYNVAPHFGSDHFESNAINKVISYWIENKILFRALRDGEVLIYGPGSQQIAGLNRMA